MSEAALHTCLGKIEQEHRTGDAAEHSYPPAFKDLLDTLGQVQQISIPSRLMGEIQDTIEEHGGWPRA